MHISRFSLTLTLLFACPAQARLLDKCASLLTAPFISAQSRPLDARAWKGLDEPATYAGLVTSQWQEVDGRFEIEGAWPEGLEGTYVRMGPYGFDSRAGERKNSLLDSAGGMIREFRLDPQDPQFKLRHVQTDAYLEEKRSGRFLYPSIETLSAVGWNSALRSANQASVAAYPRGNEYWVTDDWKNPVRMCRSDLVTLGEHVLHPEEPNLRYLAHAKRDPRTGELCFMAMRPGWPTSARVTCLDAKNQPTSTRDFTLPKTPGIPYFHDWALTDNHIVIYLHPQFLDFKGLFQAAVGIKPLMSALRFRSEIPARILLIERENLAVHSVEVPDSLQVWHFVNAFETRGELILDLAASKPNSLNVAGGDSFKLAMRGEDIPPAPPQVAIWRHKMDLSTRTLQSVQRRMDDANYEFPQIHPEHQGRPYRYAYFARSSQPTPWSDGITKWNTEDGSTSTYRFPQHQLSGEPVFVVRKSARTEDDGYLLVDVYDSNTKRSFVAIFDARDPAYGPVAKLHLPLHLPFAFHGTHIPKGY